MQVVNIRELKAKLSAYLREVARGETFLVTDRGRVVARLGPNAELAVADEEGALAAKLTRLGIRPPLRKRGHGDYARRGELGLPTPAIDALLDWSRGE